MSTLINTKLLGGTLLLTGTAIGGGLLAVPIATAEAGFLNSSLLLTTCWLFMTASALLTLEVSLWLPKDANIISMTRVFLNKGTTVIAWLSYLLLLYSIMAAYISEGANFITHLITPYFQKYPFQNIAALIFTAALGSIVYKGIVWVDYLNRGLMVAKLSLYALLVALISPHISAENLLLGSPYSAFKGFGVLITSFAYSNIIPTLRNYFQDDVPNLRKAILIGSTIPFVCYLLWNATIMGVIPLYSNHGLIQLSHSIDPVSSLMHQLNRLLNSHLIAILSNSFRCICVLTTFLTCSLGLSDFLADGLKLKKKTSYRNDWMIYGTTFLPPLCITLFFKSIFITALQYAGIYCLILFCLLPVMIAWQGRYRLHRSSSAYQMSGGKPSLIILSIIAVVSLVCTIYNIVIY